MAAVTPPGSVAPFPAERSTLSDALERRRLEYREVQVERVLRVLRGREIARSSGDRVPAPLREAVRGFEEELTEVRKRLRRLRA